MTEVRQQSLRGPYPLYPEENIPASSRYARTRQANPYVETEVKEQLKPGDNILERSQSVHYSFWGGWVCRRVFPLITRQELVDMDMFPAHEERPIWTTAWNAILHDAEACQVNLIADCIGLTSVTGLDRTNLARLGKEVKYLFNVSIESPMLHFEGKSFRIPVSSLVLYPSSYLILSVICLISTLIYFFTYRWKTTTSTSKYCPTLRKWLS